MPIVTLKVRTSCGLESESGFDGRPVTAWEISKLGRLSLNL